MIGQSRLLALLAKIDSPESRKSHFEEVEKLYKCKNLLQFAVKEMVDYNGDVIMHLGLMQFFAQWLRESISHGPR